MIKATFTRDEAGWISKFEIIGHAASGPYGSDIVCAAVSALSISTVNGLEALAGIQPCVDIDSDNGGYLSCCLSDMETKEQFNIAQILLENLLLAVVNMTDEYSDYLEVHTINQ